MTIQKAKKLKDNSNLLDIMYLAFLMLALRFSSIFEHGALYSLVFPMAFEVGRAVSYWMKSSDPSLTDSRTKIGLNRAFYTVRAGAIVAGLTLALLGNFTLGFALLNSMGYVSMFRVLGKMVGYAREGNQKKVESNLGKVMVGGTITVGFSLMTFFPVVVSPWVPFALILSASSYVLFSVAKAEAAPIILKAFSPEKGALSYMKINENDDDIKRSPSLITPLLNGQKEKDRVVTVNVEVQTTPSLFKA